MESALTFAIVAHMVSRGLAPRAPRGMAIGVARQSFNLIFGFGLSIPVFFVTTNAWILWFAVPALVARFATSAGEGATGRPAGHGARVTQPPVATGRAGSATQLDQEPT
jgi:hypothetical protein